MPGRLDHHDADRTGFKDFLDDRALGVAQRRRRVGIGRVYGRSFIRMRSPPDPGVGTYLLGFNSPLLASFSRRL